MTYELLLGDWALADRPPFGFKRAIVWVPRRAVLATFCLVSSSEYQHHIFNAFNGIVHAVNSCLCLSPRQTFPLPDSVRLKLEKSRVLPGCYYQKRGKVSLCQLFLHRPKCQYEKKYDLKMMKVVLNHKLNFHCFSLRWFTANSQ